MTSERLWRRVFLTSLDPSNNIVITMKSIPVAVRRIGNSLGIVIPKPVLAQVGLSDQAELTVERGAIVLRKPRKAARAGWSKAAKSVAGQGGDELLMGDFANAADLELDW
jgi:antitoxin MazE